MNYFFNGQLSLDDIANAVFNNGPLRALESQLMSKINQISNASPGEMLQLQVMLQIYTSTIQASSSIVKAFADAIKQVANNSGT